MLGTILESLSLAAGMRFFFAALPGPDVCRQLEFASDTLQLPPDARRVPGEKYHLTVAFAGEVSQAQAAALRAVGARARPATFTVSFDSYEYWRKSEVVVAASSDCPPELLDLHRRLRAEFERLGLIRDGMAFRAHVTLARKVTQAPVLKAMSPICWRVQGLHLVQSSGSAAGSVYTVVDTWSLLDSVPRGE
jgi:RNA 2',3'-cyclic 3'-phosphodiesterase